MLFAIAVPSILFPAMGVGELEKKWADKFENDRQGWLEAVRDRGEEQVLPKLYEGLCDSRRKNVHENRE